jgi:hypothetical protein
MTVVAAATGRRGSYFPRPSYKYQKAPVAQRYKLLGRNPHPSTTGVHRFDSWGFLAAPFTAGSGRFCYSGKGLFFWFSSSNSHEAMRLVLCATSDSASQNQSRSTNSYDCGDDGVVLVVVTYHTSGLERAAE